MRKSVVLTLSLLFAFLLCPVVSWAQKISGNVDVHFIDVGQADAILVMSPKRECVLLIDSGDTRYPGSSKSFREYMLAKLPKGHRIHLAVASHPHADHIGSMRWVLQNYRVEKYIDNGQEYDSALYRNLMGEVKKRANAGLSHFAHGSVTPKDQDFCPAENLNTELLYPKEGYKKEFCDRNQNDCSVVLRMTYDESSFLFPGDAEKEQEEILLKDQAVRAKLRAHVLKAAHHGSDTSSSWEFLEAVSPAWLVVSSGKKEVGTNKGYKHPRLSTIRNLLHFAGEEKNRRSIDVYDADKRVWARKSIWGNLFVTAKDGTVILSSDGKEIRKE